MSAALAAVLCLAIGYSSVSLLRPRTHSLPSDLILRLALSFGFGLGTFSCVFFVGKVANASDHALFVADIVLCAAALATFVRKERRFSARNATSAKARPAGAWLQRLAGFAFAFSLVVSVVSCVRRLLITPLGYGWDAFAIWNLHARFLFLGGERWRDRFSSPALHWSHPDYPLLLPGAVAHFWTYLGTDSPVVPATIAFGFTLGTVAVLVSALRILRGSTPASLAGIALLGTPYFLQRGVSQFADVPLGFFYLATLVLLNLQDSDTSSSRGLLALAGAMAGFAAWTKNEGLLFLACICALQLLSALRSPDPRSTLFRSAPLFLGLLPILFVVGYFKFHIAGPGDLVSTPAAIVQRLLTPQRYWKIFWRTLSEFFIFGHWVLIPIPALGIAYAVCTRKRPAANCANPAKGTKVEGSGAGISIQTLLLTLAGYMAIYVITPYDLSWHLHTSLHRLLVQLWPSIIFLFFLSAWPTASPVDLGPRQQLEALAGTVDD